MLNIFYTVFIFPIEQLIELAYLFIYRIFNNPAVSLLGVSFAVSVLTLPLYFMAEKHQRAEQDIQKHMKPEVDNIKAVFSGDERFMRLAAYYRQNGYHPLSSLKSSISLIIQLPFFIAAYHFISNLEVIKNISFGPIKDMARPDSLLTIKSFTVNVLPILMTIISCAAAGIYTKGFSARDKIQLYGMAAIFLVLLYNSPSGLVLYWTGNNLFSLFKNFIQKTKNSKKTTKGLIIALSLFLFVCVLYYTNVWTIRRILLVLIFILIPSFLLFYSFFIKKHYYNLTLKFKREYHPDTRIFLLSIIILFLLAGLVIPLSLIASSVQEFSFIENYKSPFPFIINTVLQSIGIFIFWPLCIYYMLGVFYKNAFEKLSVVLTGVAIINVFLFPGKYGYLTLLFTFSENPYSNGIVIFLNILIIIIFTLVLFLVFRFKKIILSVLIIGVCTCGLLSFIYINKINREFKSIDFRSDNKTFTYEPIYRFSKTGKNILVIMLDTAISRYIPYIFKEKPELSKSFDGFTWYKNTISFGGHTNFGTPGLFGGYEYTPLEIQGRKDTLLVEKQNQALLLLPKILLNYGFNVTVTDPPYANYRWIPDLSIFADYPQIKAENIIGKYNNKWLLDNKHEILLIDITEIIKSTLIRFSFFKLAPLSFRNFVYDTGNWLLMKNNENRNISHRVLDNYLSLYILPYITEIKESGSNTYIAISNELPHDPAPLQAPDYTLLNTATNETENIFIYNDYYPINISALMLLGKWFDFLKENDVYDNSRIIIVSDHGNPSSKDRNIESIDNIILPNGDMSVDYAALLLVKDFYSHGLLSVDDSFMTNADVPLLVLKDIVENPINPWTGNKLTSNKQNGATITTSHLWDINRHNKYQFNIKPDQWLHVHTDIYDPKNWNEVK